MNHTAVIRQDFYGYVIERATHPPCRSGQESSTQSHSNFGLSAATPTAGPTRGSRGPAGWLPSGISTATTGARDRSSSSTAAISPTTPSCNGNEYAKQMAARAGIGFTALDNGFA